MLKQFSEQSHRARLNWLRASVLGVNDGIVSIAGLVVGVAGANSSASTIALAGFAGLIAGAFSMAAGEYVSVSTQRDAEKAYIAQEKKQLKTDPEGAQRELAGAYVSRGLSEKTARIVAAELTKNNALGAHLEVEFGISEDDLTNPWHAGIASAVSFTIGGIVPILAVLLPPDELRIPVAFSVVAPTLVMAGYVSAKLSDADRYRAVVRVVVGGCVAMAVTYAVGHLFGVSGI